MPTKQMRRKLKSSNEFLGSASKRASLGALLLGLTLSTASAELIDIPSSPIDRQGAPISASQERIRQVQAQIPQPPAPIQAPVPIQPGGAPAPVPLQNPGLQNAPIQNAPQPLNLNSNGLNANPNADISELAQPTLPPEPSATRNFSNTRPALGAVAGEFSAAPNMIGDTFQGGLTIFQGSTTQNFTVTALGTVLSGVDGGANSLLAFESGSDIVPNDFFSTGIGSDLSPGSDGFADTFSILEPFPPNDAPTSPGPGFTFDGGTATFTGVAGPTTAQPGIYTDGSQWFIAYSYTSAIGTVVQGAQLRPVTGPGVAIRRVKISENFSPEVRDRAFLSYNFFNDVIGGLGDISRYTLGFERVLVDDLISVEARLPMAGTYGSTQNLDGPESRDFEIGNAALIGKAVLLRTNRLLWTGGMGISLPSADDSVYQMGGQNILRIENETVRLMPFTAFSWKRSRNTTLQFYTQFDFATNDDSVLFDLAGGDLPEIGEYSDASLVHLDASISRVLYRSKDRCSRLQQVIGNSELHYTGSLEDADVVRDPTGGFEFGSLQSRVNILNATTGLHLLLGNNVVVTPAVTVPLRDGLDEEFDYEATVQLNYLR